MCYHQVVIAVVDTNVLVAAMIGGHGASREVVRACLKGRIQPLVGAALFAEYESVMAREALFARSVLAPREREAVLDAYLSVCRWVRIYFLWRPFLRDPGDEMVLEVAVGARASRIVTHNVRDFEGVEAKFGIRIVTPGEFLTEVREKP